jgi:hypothetical protein
MVHDSPYHGTENKHSKQSWVRIAPHRQKTSIDVHDACACAGRAATKDPLSVLLSASTAVAAAFLSLQQSAQQDLQPRFLLLQEQPALEQCKLIHIKSMPNT